MFISYAECNNIVSEFTRMLEEAEVIYLNHILNKEDWM